MLILFQKALSQQLSSYPILSEVITNIYTYKPIDHTPPYIYVTMHHSNLQENNHIYYGNVDVYLVVRENGLLQSIQLNNDLIKLLNKKTQLIYHDKIFNFIFQIREAVYKVDSDSITKTYHYQGRLKIKGKN